MSLDVLREAKSISEGDAVVTGSGSTVAGLRAVPAKISFPGYEFGKTQQQIATIVNGGSKSQRVRVALRNASDPHFHIEIKNKRALLAPGISENIIVTFTPPSAANGEMMNGKNDAKNSGGSSSSVLTNCITVFTEQGEMNVPVSAYPLLNAEKRKYLFPKVVNMGMPALGLPLVRRIPLKCTAPLGTPGFRFRLEILRPHPDVKITPLIGLIEPQATQYITVTYCPQRRVTVRVLVRFSWDEVDAKPYDCELVGGVADEEGISLVEPPPPPSSKVNPYTHMHPKPPREPRGESQLQGAQKKVRRFRGIKDHVVDGVHVPADLLRMGQAGVDYLLKQAPGQGYSLMLHHQKQLAKTGQSAKFMRTGVKAKLPLSPGTIAARRAEEEAREAAARKVKDERAKTYGLQGVGHSQDFSDPAAGPNVEVTFDGGENLHKKKIQFNQDLHAYEKHEQALDMVPTKVRIGQRLMTPKQKRALEEATAMYNHRKVLQAQEDARQSYQHILIDANKQRVVHVRSGIKVKATTDGAVPMEKVKQDDVIVDDDELNALGSTLVAAPSNAVDSHTTSSVASLETGDWEKRKRSLATFISLATKLLVQQRVERRLPKIKQAVKAINAAQQAYASSRPSSTRTEMTPTTAASSRPTHGIASSSSGADRGEKLTSLLLMTPDDVQRNTFPSYSKTVTTATIDVDLRHSASLAIPVSTVEPILRLRESNVYEDGNYDFSLPYVNEFQFEAAATQDPLLRYRRGAVEEGGVLFDGIDNAPDEQTQDEKMEASNAARREKIEKAAKKGAKLKSLVSDLTATAMASTEKKPLTASEMLAQKAERRYAWGSETAEGSLSAGAQGHVSSSAKTPASAVEVDEPLCVPMWLQRRCPSAKLEALRTHAELSVYAPLLQGSETSPTHVLTGRTHSLLTRAYHVHSPHLNDIVENTTGTTGLSLKPASLSLPYDDSFFTEQPCVTLASAPVGLSRVWRRSQQGGLSFPLQCWNFEDETHGVYRVDVEGDDIHVGNAGPDDCSVGIVGPGGMTSIPYVQPTLHPADDMPSYDYEPDGDEVEEERSAVRSKEARPYVFPKALVPSAELAAVLFASDDNAAQGVGLNLAKPTTDGDGEANAQSRKKKSTRKKPNSKPGSAKSSRKAAREKTLAAAAAAENAPALTEAQSRRRGVQRGEAVFRLNEALLHSRLMKSVEMSADLES